MKSASTIHLCKAQKSTNVTLRNIYRLFWQDSEVALHFIITML